MERNREKVPKTHIDERGVIDVKPFPEEFSTRAKRDGMPSIIRKMARDHRKSIIGEIARRDRHRAAPQFRRSLARRRFMAP